MTDSSAPASTSVTVSNSQIVATYKRIQAEGGGWEAIGKALGMKANAASGRINTIKTEMFELLSKAQNGDGSRRFTVNQIDELIDKAFPPIKRTGGGRKSDKSETVLGLIADLGVNLDTPPAPEAPEAPEAPADSTESTVDVK